MLRLKLLSAPMFLFLAAQSLPAQPTATETSSNLQEATDQLLLKTGLTDFSYSSPPTNTDTGVAIELSETDSSGKARLAFPVHHGTLALTFEAPIDKDTERSDAIDENGFSNGVAFGIDYTRFLLPSSKKPKPMWANSMALCKEYLNFLSATERQELFKDIEEKEGADKGRIELGMKDGKSRDDVLLELRCTDDKLLPEIVEKIRKADVYSARLKALRDSAHDRSAIPLLSFGAKLGVQDFDFAELDPTEETGIGEDSVREEPRSIRVSAGVLWTSAKNDDRVFWLTYLRSTSFKDAATAEICTPIGDSGLENCSDEPFGPPAKKEQDLLIAEFRTFICGGGLALKGIYDLEAEKAGGRAEYFFLKTSEGSLTGGIGVEWDEETGTSGSLFLTKGFTLGPS